MSVTINVPINTLTYSGVNVVNTIICTFIFEIMVVSLFKKAFLLFDETVKKFKLKLH